MKTSRVINFKLMFLLINGDCGAAPYQASRDSGSLQIQRVKIYNRHILTMTYFPIKVPLQQHLPQGFLILRRRSSLPASVFTFSHSMTVRAWYWSISQAPKTDKEVISQCLFGKRGLWSARKLVFDLQGCCERSSWVHTHLSLGTAGSSPAFSFWGAHCPVPVSVHPVPGSSVLLDHQSCQPGPLRPALPTAAHMSHEA